MVVWNARGLLHSDARLRRRKLALLASYMKVNAIIAVQEVHGSEDALGIFLQAQPQKYLSFLSPGFPCVRFASCSILTDARYLVKHANLRVFIGSKSPRHLVKYTKSPVDIHVNAELHPVESQWPTHYDKSCKPLSTIDRIFLGIDAHAMLSVSTILTTARDAMELSEAGISDHAPLVLQITAARRVPRDEQPIPTHLFNHRKYPEAYSLMLDHCALEGETAEGRWRAAKQCMKLAARRVRDEQLRTNFSLLVKDSTVETSYMGFKSAARAVWRQDAVLAGRLLDSCPAMAAHLQVTDGNVHIVDPTDSQVAQRVVTDPAGMKMTVANYWGEIFAKPIATSSTSPEQKGFTAGRRFVDHIPFLDAECRREGLLPDAMTRRPMFLSFDFRQAFPSLFREVIEKVLPRFGVPRGFRSVIEALYSNCLAFSSFRAEGTSAELEPLFALMCGIMQGCPLSGTIWCLAMDAPIRALLAAIAEHGSLKACADDLGMLIKNAVALPSIDHTFVSIELAFNLQLALHKCVLVPLWEEITDDTLQNVKSFLAEEVPRWLGFRIDSSAKYLGTHLGPGVTDFGIWKAAVGKWWTRCWELARTGMATSLAARACNINALPCLSYLAQFYFIVPAIWKVEFTSLHRLLRLPPSSMRKADILSLSAWCGSPSPIGLFPYTIAAMMRSAENTVRGWEAHLRHLHEAAVEHVPLTDVIKGNWSPPWWRTRRAIVQNYALISDAYGQLDIPRPTLDTIAVPIPSRFIQKAKSAMLLETKTAAAATPPRKPKRQATAAAVLRGSLYPEDLVPTFHRRLRRWGVECSLPVLRERWPPLRSKLTEVRPAWMWSWMRAAVNGWTTSRRMSAVIDARPCLFGCDDEDALEHYIHCPILRAMAAGDTGADAIGNGLELLGFGDELCHSKRPIADCIYTVGLMCQCYHIQKHRMDVGLAVGADQRASVRLAALHRMQA
ncbi:unnamed protein product [Prorocentrum cordatum]|uniref:Reverse transcriptase domain-containing protein n=1 Tax=Prorocentrum cordatum TaxID=2364126 RepID=A0ABN9WQ99_9DINO|nr:unnamed protein product [Polarella glacialis]